MWPFKRKEKQVYFILWSMCDPGAVFTDYISAVNSEKAWKKLRRKWHCPNAILRKIEVYDNEGYDWEEKKWEQRLTVAIVELIQDKSKQIDFTNDNVCPANIVNTLRKMGWEDDAQTENGWENDTWIPLAHEDYNFCLILYYCGYTFELKLYRSDIDD